MADSADRAALDALAARARVVATTVGPYARYGLPLAEACAAAGTHYADLTGEVLFVRDCVDACDEVAKRTGARIVNACGYDSIPSDLAVLQLHERVAADGAGELADCTLVATAKGGFSGGTIDSARAQVDAVRRDPSRRRLLVDPYALSPDRDAEPDLGDERDSFAVFRNDDLGGWLGPFVMASFNTRIVRRSNALQQWAYGRRFRYRELSAYGRGTAARSAANLVTAGLGLGLKAWPAVGCVRSPTACCRSPGRGRTSSSGRRAASACASTRPRRTARTTSPPLRRKGIPATPPPP